MKLCKSLDLFGRELIAIDGSKFSAVNHNARNFTKDKLKSLLKKINEQIEDFEVTNDINDMNQLSNMAIKAKKALGVDKITATADTGYHNEPEIAKCEQENISCYVPKLNLKLRKMNFFPKQIFNTMLAMIIIFALQIRN